MTFVPHRCPACPERQYYGVLVETGKTPPRCANCNRQVVPARKSA